MQTPLATQSSSKQSLFGWLRFPIAVLVIGSFLLFLLSQWRDPNIQKWHMELAKTSIGILMIFLLFLWVFFATRIRKSQTIIGALVLVVVGMGMFKVRFTGDMEMSVEPREWLARLLGVSHFDRLNAQRKSHTSTGTTVDLTEQPNDWPEFRGRDRTGIVRGSNISRDWDAKPPKVLWKQLVGKGYAAFSVANGHLVTIEQQRIDKVDLEVVACYNAKTGEEEWRCSWPANFDETMGGPGPRATPTIHKGLVYALGAEGRLVCIDGSNGQEKWSANILENNKNLTWAMSGSPLVVDDLVIVSPGKQTDAANGRSVIAYDRLTGKEVWVSGSYRGSYSSPELVTLCGQKQILVFDAEGCGSYNPTDGKPLWHFAWYNGTAVNVAQPLVIGENRVCISSGYNRGTVLIQLAKEGDKWNVSEVWQTKQSVMRCKFTTPLVHNGYLYGLNDGAMECVDLKTGKQVWKDERRSEREGFYSHGQFLLSGDFIIGTTEYGDVVLVEASPEELKEIGRMKKVIDSYRTWNTPALVDGILYIRNDREMAAIDLR
jgi:outer membrane protein assembly factor BamB